MPLLPKEGKGGAASLCEVREGGCEVWEGVAEEASEGEAGEGMPWV